MTLVVALVGMIILIGLGGAVGLVERQSAERAFRSIAARRRDNWEEKRRLEEHALDLAEWERLLRQEQGRLNRLERRIRKLEYEPASEIDESDGQDTCETEDDEWRDEP